MDQLPTPPTLEDLEKQVKVARAFRGVLIAFGLHYLFWFVASFFSSVAEDATPAATAVSAAIAIVCMFCWFVAGVSMLVHVYRLTTAMGSVGLLWVIAMFMPCLNLLILLALNSRAATFCKKEGMKVGLLGVSPSEIERIDRARREASTGL